MSVLDDVLKEEYERLLRMKKAMTAEYDKLPKEYLSKKNINGHECFYLQHREGDKIKSVYVNEKDVEDYAAKIERRRSLKKSLQDIEKELKKIERTIK